MSTALKKKVFNQLKSWLNLLPYIHTLHQFKTDYEKNSMFYPGHYYSVIPEKSELIAMQEQIWQETEKSTINDINLNTGEQLELLEQIATVYAQLDFPRHHSNEHRYYYENPMYSYTDAIFLSSMLIIKKPKRVIEIGSGYSSAVILDTKDLFLEHNVQLTFIEPYPERLNSLLSQTDKAQVTLITEKLQDVNFALFHNLECDDILFIDSSHVLKTGSDLYFLLFQIIPNLKSGVIIHFHDIFYPLGYTKAVAMSGRNWNEAYFLRAFLMNNADYRILLFSDYLHKFHSDAFLTMPLTYENTGGNLWIRKN